MNFGPLTKSYRRACWPTQDHHSACCVG